MGARGLTVAGRDYADGVVHAVPKGWTRPSPSSWLGRLLERRARHPDEFDCALRVVSGHVDGESERWRYRRSAVDPLVRADGVVHLNHGTVARLQLRFTGPRLTRPGLRQYHVAWPATEVRTGARVEVAADPSEAVRFRIPD